MGKRWWWLVAPVVLGFLVLTFARANAAGPFCGGFHGSHAAARSPAEVEERLSRKIEHLLDAVDASEAQRKQADALVAALAPELFGLMNEGRSLRGELKTALLAEKLDNTRIDALRTRLSELAERLLDTSMDGVVKVSELLTPAQRKQVADKLARMHL